MAAVQAVARRLLQQPVAGFIQPDARGDGHLVAGPHQPDAGVGGATTEPAALIQVLQAGTGHQGFGEREHVITVEIGEQQNAGHEETSLTGEPSI